MTTLDQEKYTLPLDNDIDPILLLSSVEVEGPFRLPKFELNRRCTFNHLLELADKDKERPAEMSVFLWLSRNMAYLLHRLLIVDSNTLLNAVSEVFKAKVDRLGVTDTSSLYHAVELDWTLQLSEMPDIPGFDYSIFTKRDIFVKGPTWPDDIDQDIETSGELSSGVSISL